MGLTTSRGKRENSVFAEISFDNLIFNIIVRKPEVQGQTFINIFRPLSHLGSLQLGQMLWKPYSSTNFQQLKQEKSFLLSIPPGLGTQHPPTLLTMHICPASWPISGWPSSGFFNLRQNLKSIQETYWEEQACLNIPSTVEALESYRNLPGEERESEKVGKHIFPWPYLRNSRKEA